MSWAADFNVTTPGGQFAFNINSVNGPTITLVRGRLYEFNINTTPSFHPFQLMGAGVPLGPSFGVTNNNITAGSIFFRVPTNAVNYSYRCGFHTGTTSLQGTIQTTEPPTPPVPRIVSYSFGTNIVLRSTPATNTFTIIPEFKTNLNNSNWFALTVQTNRFLNGTNETICGVPSGSNVFIRVRVQ